MMRIPFEAIPADREKQRRSKKPPVSRHRTRPEVELLEDRWLLATLLYVGAVGNANNWSDPVNVVFADMTTGASAIPANGDSLIFDPTQATQGVVRQGTVTGPRTTLTNCRWRT